MTRRPGKRRIRAGALVIIAALMIGSALLRFGVFAAPAIAREAGARDSAADTATPPDAAGGDAAAGADQDDLRQLLAALQARGRDLDNRERLIEDRMKALSIAGTAVEQKLTALIEAENRLRDTLALADGAAEGDLTRLTEVYEKMKPKDSATLFEQMQPEFAAGFLARMKPQSAAEIMAGMDPTAAYAISVVLAGRNAAVPTD